MKATVDRLAIAAVLFSAAAIVLVVAVALWSVRDLVAVGDRVTEVRRVKSSLESLRFAAMGLESSQQSYVITGNAEELSSMRSGAAVMRTELATLAKHRRDLPILASEYEALAQTVSAFVAAERKLAELRRDQGFNAAQARILRQDDAASIQYELLTIIYRMMAEANKKLDQLELEQTKVSSGVQTWLVVLVSAAALVLVVLTMALKRMSLTQRRAQEKLSYQAAHDSLTGLHNRQAVIDHLSERLNNAETERAFGGFAIMLIDLDGFKSVNDLHGHDAGDEVLRQASSRMQRLLRDSDFLARLGGDEFLVVIPQVSDQETASLVGNKLIDGLSAPYPLAGGVTAPAISASIGASFFPAHGSDREGLMRAADTAMYAAKHQGRSRLSFAPVSA